MIPTEFARALAGRYRLDREAGRGGMATVYLADDLKHGRRVAIKVMRPELAAAIGPDRFLREIEIAARRCGELGRRDGTLRRAPGRGGPALRGGPRARRA